MEDFVRLLAGGENVTWFGDPSEQPGPPTPGMEAVGRTFSPSGARSMQRHSSAEGLPASRVISEVSIGRLPEPTKCGLHHDEVAPVPGVQVTLKTPIVVDDVDNEVAVGRP